MPTHIDGYREIRFIRCSIFATVIAFLGLYGGIATRAYGAYQAGNGKALVAAAIFSTVIFFIAYGSLLYQLCLMGYYKRRIKHSPATREALESIYDGAAPSLAVLVPSYKEEVAIVRQTMLSAALAEYPQKSIVLLIDDPYLPRVLEDSIKLEKARELTDELQVLFETQLGQYRAQEAKFRERCEGGEVFHAMELNRLSLLHEEVAEWFEKLAAHCQGKRDWDSLAHGERFFLSRIVLDPARQHREFAGQLRGMIMKNRRVKVAWLQRQYARLASIFNVSFSRFERKKYVNFSHESNKAMNLNSYIALMGKSWCEVETKAGLELQECSAQDADFTIPGFDYVNTIDADTLMTSDYALRLIHEMQKPGNERLAVAQSPCSTIPGCPHPLERAAGAYLDVQFLTHQGYTHWGASFWVGANAMLRRTALEDIKETRLERGHEIAIYIQDNTVIEDTESSVHLIYKGWQIYNYPARMTFSPMPPDFGSLLIQRRRWANGGMIILPKLLGYAMRSPVSLRMLKEFIIRFNYLAATTLACIASALAVVCPFEGFSATYWLPIAVAPFFLLLMRDLSNAGYRRSEMLRIYAVNLLLLPVVTGGVLKQFQQMLTGKKIPFGRTPKVPGRTAAPLVYYLVEILMLFGFISMTVNNVLGANWVQVGFCGANAAFMGYALTHLIGFKAMAQDFAASVLMYWRNIFYHAEIIPLPARRILSSGSAAARARA